MYCEFCKKEIDNDSKFCVFCGSKTIQEHRQLPIQQNPVKFDPSQVPIKNYNPDLDYNPISMWGYYFYTILLNIPVVGWLCMLMFSFGITKNVNLRNYARSWLCGYIVAVILAVVKWGPYISLLLE